MNQEDPDPGSRLDPRAVPVVIASLAVVVLGIFTTYADLTIGAVIVLLGLCGVAWVAQMAAK
ncbi:MAG: hypothetical protein ACSLFF_00905 [Solirubrobacterales bacterium]